MMDLWRRWRTSAVAVLVALTAAQTASAEPAVAPGGEPAPSPALAAPVLRTRVEAAYPPDALRDGLEANVGLEVVVDERGVVVDAKVTSPAGHGFDEAALDAVRKFTFDPARDHEAAVRSMVQLAYEFHSARAPTPPPPPPPPSTCRARSGLHPCKRAPTSRRSSRADAARRDRPAARAHRRVRFDHEPAASSRSARASAPRDLLEAVPGLFTVQHAGGGKAQQYFMRGFDLDHGTDFAVFVDGAPVNAVSHAHGQGYSTCTSSSPRRSTRSSPRRGPTRPRVGDFATAGLGRRSTWPITSTESIAQARDRRRTGTSAPSSSSRPTSATGGAWRRGGASSTRTARSSIPEDFDRFNAYARRRACSTSAASSRSMLDGATAASWNMSGVLPARAVCGEGDGTPTPAAYAGSHCINRCDSVDPSQGGASQRVHGADAVPPAVRRSGDVEATLYALHSNLQLFPNDGIAALVPARRASSTARRSSRTTRAPSPGRTSRLTRRATSAAADARPPLGLQIRNDEIEAQLHRTEQRRRLDGMPGIPGPIYDGRHQRDRDRAPTSRKTGAPRSWLRFVLGARGDRIDAAVNNESDARSTRRPATQGAAALAQGDGVVSPMSRGRPLRQLRARLPLQRRAHAPRGPARRR